MREIWRVRNLSDQTISLENHAINGGGYKDIRGVVGIAYFADSSAVVAALANGLIEIDRMIDDILYEVYDSSNPYDISPARLSDVEGSTPSLTGDGSGLTNLNASHLTTGTVFSARLGTGSASNTTFLRGDLTWQAISSLLPQALGTTDSPTFAGITTSSLQSGGGPLNFSGSLVGINGSPLFFDNYTYVIGNSNGSASFNGNFGFSGKLSITSTQSFLLNGSTDTNWQIGLGVGLLSTQSIGQNTSIQIVTGAGSDGPDGFAIGNCNGSSWFEVRGDDGNIQLNGNTNLNGNQLRMGNGSYIQSDGDLGLNLVDALGATLQWDTDNYGLNLNNNDVCNAQEVTFSTGSRIVDDDSGGMYLWGSSSVGVQVDSNGSFYATALQVSGSLNVSGGATFSGSSNQLHIDRINTGGYGQAIFTTGGVHDWAIGTRAGDSNFYFNYNSTDSSTALTLGSDGSATFAGNVSLGSNTLTAGSATFGGDVNIEGTIITGNGAGISLENSTKNAFNNLTIGNLTTIGGAIISGAATIFGTLSSAGATFSGPTTVNDPSATGTAFSVGADVVLGYTTLVSNLLTNVGYGYSYPGSQANVDLGSAQVATRYTVSSGNGGVFYISGWTFYGSNDNTNFTVLDTQSGQSGSGTYDISNTTGYRYYRFTCNTVVGGGAYQTEFSILSATTRTHLASRLAVDLNTGRAGSGTATPTAQWSVVGSNTANLIDAGNTDGSPLFVVDGSGNLSTSGLISAGNLSSSGYMNCSSGYFGSLGFYGTSGNGLISGNQFAFGWASTATISNANALTITSNNNGNLTLRAPGASVNVIDFLSAGSATFGGDVGVTGQLTVGMNTFNDNGSATIGGNLTVGYAIHTPQISQTQQTLTYGSTLTWALTSGGNAVVTLTGNATLNAPISGVAGSTYLLIVKQDSTGGRTLSYNSGFKWVNGVVPALSTNANSVDFISFYYDGTTFYGVASKGFA